MDLKQLVYFDAVVNEGSFSQAARQIYIAQPALSRKIRALEKDLGVKLLIRTSQGVQLTAAGEVFHRDIKQILNQLTHAEQKIRLFEQGQAGEIVIGRTVMLLWVKELAEFFHVFRTRFPQVILKMNTMLSGPQIKSLQQGQIDVGLLFFPPTDSCLNAIKVHTDRLVLVMHSSSPLAKNPPKKLADIGQHDFIWFDREATCNYHDHLINHFHQNGFFPNVVERGSDNAAMLTLVSSGVGCTIVPEMSTVNLPSNVVSIGLNDLDLPMELMLVWRRGSMSPTVKNMISIAMEHSSNEV
ncbi:MAG: LysR family transcriptional regulator [Psychrobacter sp.]|uniref:LysR family transcriptional regulator n=1 Tax=unclassified Psychrobacter TaxID=196806 RepID=UPI003F9B1B32